MTAYDVRGFDVAVSAGKDSAVSALQDVYASFPRVETADPDIEIVVGDRPMRDELKLGGAKRSFGRVDETFVLRDHGSGLAIDHEWDRFTCFGVPSTSRLTTLIEGELRNRLATYGQAMIHGSAICYEGETVLFPAWRHTGKTNTMLSFLIRGAEFLADDRLLVDRSGTAYSFPVPINLLQYNLRAFPDVVSGSDFSTTRASMSRALASATADMSEHSFVRGVIDYVNNHVIKQSVSVPVTKLSPDVSVPETASVDKIVLLQTTEADERAHAIEALPPADLRRALTAITEYEWNASLDRIYNAFDMLFPDQESRARQLSDLRTRERTIHEGIVENADTYRLTVPVEDDWNAATRRRIVDAVVAA